MRLAAAAGHRDLDLLLWSNVTWGMGNGFFTYLLPLYVAGLGASPIQIGGVLATMEVVRALIYVPAGLLADRIGRKPVMLLGWGLGPVAMILLGFAHSWTDVIPALILFAAVELCAPAYHGYIATAATGRDLTYAFTLMTLGAASGTAISAPIGGQLAERAGPSTLFASAFVAYAVSTGFVALLRPDPFPPGPTDAGGETTHQRARRAWWQAIRALAAWRVPAPLATTLLVTGVTIFAANLAQPLAPNWLSDRYGYTPADVGAFGSISALAAAALSFGIGRRQRQRGAVWGVRVTSLLLAAYATLLLVAGSPVLAGAAYALRGAYTVIPSLVVALTAAALLQTPAAGHRRTSSGLGFALNKTIASAALMLSTFLAGWLYSLGPALPFLASIALLLPLPWLVRLVYGKGQRPVPSAARP